MAITMTDFAIKKVTGIMKKRQTPDQYLRVGLKGGGCSGYSYTYEFVEEPTKRDKIFQFGSVKICIDMKSYMFLNGMEIDYKEDLLKSGLELSVPSVTRTCGCGESVAF